MRTEAPPPRVPLKERWAKATREQSMHELPEFDAKVDADPKAKNWIEKQLIRIGQSIKDDDEILFEEAVGTWVKACERINELIAEDYRQANTDPTLWDLRYVRWMTRLTFIKFGSPMGEFYLVPRMPRTRPKAEFWYTVDEMVDMLHPTTAAAIAAFGKLPARPSSLRRPEDGEKHLHVDLTGDTPQVHYDFRGAVDRGGKGIR